MRRRDRSTLEQTHEEEEEEEKEGEGEGKRMNCIQYTVRRLISSDVSIGCVHVPVLFAT